MLKPEEDRQDYCLYLLFLSRAENFIFRTLILERERESTRDIHEIRSNASVASYGTGPHT